jgi:hypothetical protein
MYTGINRSKSFSCRFSAPFRLKERLAPAPPNLHRNNLKNHRRGWVAPVFVTPFHQQIVATAMLSTKPSAPRKALAVVLAAGEGTRMKSDTA